MSERDAKKDKGGPVSSVPPQRATLVGGYRGNSHLRLKTHPFTVLVLSDEDLRSAYDEVLKGRAARVVSCGFDTLEVLAQESSPSLLVTNEHLHSYGEKFLNKVCGERGIRLAVHRVVEYPRLVEMVEHYLTAAYPELFALFTLEDETG